MKRILVILSLLLILVGCSSNPVEKTTLKIGILPAESSLPIIIAKEQKIFESMGVAVEIIPFANPQDRNAAAQAGEIDGMIADVMTSYTFIENKMPYLITSDINEDFKILASPNSDIKTMNELNSKEVALIPGLLLEYVMDAIATKDNFTYNVLPMASFQGRFEGLLNDQFAGVVFTEPQAGMLVEKGAILLGSSSEYGIKGGALLFREETLDKHSTDVKNFYAAYNKAVDYLNSHKASEYSNVLVQYQFPEQMAAYIDAKEAPFTYAKQLPQEQLDAIATWSLKKGLIKEKADSKTATRFEVLN